MFHHADSASPGRRGVDAPAPDAGPRRPVAGCGALPNVLVHAAALPWYVSAALGAAAWARGSARTADPLRHYFVVSAGGAAAGLAAGAALAVAAGSAPVDGSSCGPAAPVCAVAVLMHVAALAAGLSLGTIFPGLLPVAAAAVSAALLEAPPGPVRLAAAIGAAALGWLVSVGAAALLIFA